MSRPDVVVVGAGPAGSAFALLLARAGVQVTIVERARFPREKPCGEAFGPGVRRFFSTHGIALPARSRPLHGIRLHAGESGVAIPFASGALGFAACRRDLDAALLAAAIAAGARTLEGVTYRWDHDDPALRAPLVAGAGGLGCPVARALGGRRFRRRTPGRIALLAHLAGVEGLTPFGEAHVVGRGFVGVAPIGVGTANVAAVYDLEDLRGATSRAPEALWRRAIEAAGLAPRLARAERRGRLQATGPLGFRPARLVASGALLVGDAAGFVDPFTGDGVSVALQSAEIAAPVALAALARGGPTREALIPYARAHRRTLGPRLRLDRVLRAGARSPSLARRLVAALAAHPELAERLLAVPADLAPARSLLAPSLLLPLTRAVLASATLGG